VLRRIGAMREGTLRHYMYSPHKGAWDVAIFSLIDVEWPGIKARLEQRLYNRNTDPTIEREEQRGY
jgi:N-acetyltransferase